MADIEMDTNLEGASLFISGHLVMAATCVHMVERVARLCDQARNRGSREAMKLLIEDAGMCESYAQRIYELLVDASPQHPTLQ